MGRAPWLTDIQLCLAHYCDTHGPTPLMVTEGLPAPCTTCFDDSTSVDAQYRSVTSHPDPSSNVTDAIRDLNLGSTTPTKNAPQQDARSQRESLLRAKMEASASTLETPPGSPRPVNQHSRADSSFRRTYDDNVTKKQGPCDNCAMTLPPRSAAASGVPSETDNNPTLRTRAPAEKVFGASGQASPPNSNTSSDTDGEKDGPRRPRNRRVLPISSRTTSCSSTSTTSEQAPFHVHYVDYTSTHEPLIPDTFSFVRASCLRTLSLETLPRPSTTAAPSMSPQSSVTPSFVTTHSAGSAGAGGSLFFGDAMTGYTTAYIFRIPDVHARGHKRVYAFMALSKHKEYMAMKTFDAIRGHFEKLATWIQHLAEVEADRVAALSPKGNNSYSVASGISQPSPRIPQQASAFDPPAVDRNGSSFLSGGGGFTRRMGTGAGASAPKSRGLADLVGQPDVFIELHKKFVQLLFEVGVSLNS